MVAIQSTCWPQNTTTPNDALQKECGHSWWARALSGKLDSTKYDLIVVSAHPYFIHYPASIRMAVTPQESLETKALVPYDKLFINGNGRFKQGIVVTAIQAERDTRRGGRVVLESGESIDYEVLVLAPGSKWEAFLDIPFDGKEAQRHIEEWRQKFLSVEKIVIAGGGAVGIELAGELREFYPDKKVTIVHGEKKLLNGTYPDRFRADVEGRVRASRARLILDDYVDSLEASETRKGIPLDADLIVPARGGRPNTSFITASLGEDVAAERGYVLIRPTMELKRYPNIFALGDIIDFPEQKQVGKTPSHVSVVVPNVLSILNGREPKKEYRGMFEAIMITYGKRGGAGYFNILWGLMIGNWITSLFKSRGLFIGMTRKTLGYSS